MAKSRIAPKGVSIPHLQLAAAQMLAKLMNHVQKTLSTTGEGDLWYDSMTTLLASKQGDVVPVRELGEWRWHYIPTNENPSDLGTKGLPPAKLSEFWFKGPHLLSDKSSWSTGPKKGTCTNGAAADQIEISDRGEWADSLLERYTYWKLLWITAYMKRFAYNCSNRIMISGPLTTEETGKAEITWLRYVQEGHDLTNGIELRRDNM